MAETVYRAPHARLKVLYEPLEHECSVDIVAVHGIGADPDRTWSRGTCNWLSDEEMLPSAVPNARIMRFAYESQWLGKEALQQRLPLVADQLLCSIVEARPKCPTRPILFVGHCFGGIVIQKAVIAARLHAKDYPNVCDAVSGIVFLGTPNRGSNTQSKAAVVASVAAATGFGEHSSLLEVIKRDSEPLRDLLHDFMRLVMSETLLLTCFFEQYKSNVAKVLTRWLTQMELVVDEESACVDGHPRFGLAADHFNLQRYSGPDDGNYQSVRAEIVRLVEAASHRVANCADATNDRRLDDAMQQKDQECLAALFLTDPEMDMNMIEAKTDRLIQDTNNWVFEHECYDRWRREEDDDVLWIHGDPGKGKTFIAIAAVRAFTRQLHFAKAASRTQLLYFFCDNKDNRRKTAVCILRGLLYQLFTQRPDLCFLLRQEYAKRKEQLLNAPSALYTLWELLHSAADAEHLDKVQIVMDGLDECEDESISDLLTLITGANRRNDSAVSLDESHSEACTIKWLITSRNEEVIRQELYDTTNIDLEANADSVTASVSQFIDVRTAQLQKAKRYSDSLAREVEATLRERAEGTFLWVALACRELSKPRVRSMNTMAVLSRLPAGLTALYEQILDQVLNNEEQDPELSEHARAVLKVMTAAFRPLSLWELAVLAFLPTETTQDRDSILEYVDLCSSIVAVRDDVACFVHESAQEYLKTREDIVPRDQALSHAVLARACFLHVCNEAFLDQDATSDVGSLSADDSPPTAHLDYCVEYWLEHMRLAERHVEESIEAEHDFLSEGSPLRQAWLDLYWHRKHPPWEKQPSDFGAVHLAAYGGLKWLVVAVLESHEEDEISRRDSLGNDCLMWAASRGWTDVVEHLVNRSANLDTANDQMLTAVYLASLKGHARVVRLLVEAGADVNCCDSRDATLVHCVTMHEHIDILRYLLKSGAKVDVRDARNRTAILWACSKGQLAAVKVLKEHGADLQQRDREGMSLLHHAAGHGHMEIATFLLKNDVRINSKCYGRWTPLHEAAWNGETSVAAFLLRSRPDLSERTGEGHTALHQAAWNGHVDCVKLLISRNAVLDATCYDGETALHQAAWKDHRDVVAALIEAGASQGVQNHDGRTPLDHAKANGAVHVVDLLVSRALNATSINDSQADGCCEPGDQQLTAIVEPPRQPAFSAVHRNDKDPSIELDPAITAVIPGDPVACNCHHHGHAGFSVPLKIRAQYADGTERFFFCKTYGNEEMFRSEFLSLKSLSSTLPTFCPQPIHVGRMEHTDHHFLLTHFIDAENTDQSCSSGPSLAQKLAALHNQPVPSPRGYDSPMFGFPMSTYCGSTPQDNTFTASWADFFANQRLGYISRLCEERHGADAELRTWVDRMIDHVVPVLLREGHLGGEAGIVPSLVHGDLWMGNQIRGKVEGWTGNQATTFDPSSVYAHNEYEFAIMRLFGGFLAGFWSQYHAVKPKTEPVEEYEDRVTLYSLYHLLNHYAMDSGGWRDDGIEVMQELWEKYGR